MAYSREDIELQNNIYKGLMPRWEYFIRSYLGGKEYSDGKFLQAYQLELESEYFKRLSYTPLDNHCRNVIDIYSSFLFRVTPSRKLGTLEEDPSVSQFLNSKSYSSASHVQFLHRIIAYFVIFIFIFIFYLFLKNKIVNSKYLFIVSFAIIFQILIGILVLVSGYKIYLASLHQLGSIFLVFSIIYLFYQVSISRKL